MANDGADPYVLERTASQIKEQLDRSKRKLARAIRMQAFLQAAELGEVVAGIKQALETAEQEAKVARAQLRVQKLHEDQQCYLATFETEMLEERRAFNAARSNALCLCRERAANELAEMHAQFERARKSPNHANGFRKSTKTFDLLHRLESVVDAQMFREAERARQELAVQEQLEIDLWLRAKKDEQHKKLTYVTEQQHKQLKNLQERWATKLVGLVTKQETRKVQLQVSTRVTNLCYEAKNTHLEHRQDYH
jgi:hypothetical protein